MARRKASPYLTGEWKDRIKAGNLMHRLQQHANGEVEMTQTQIKAADILLRKVVPDLARTEHTGVADGPPIKMTMNDEDIIKRYEAGRG